MISILDLLSEILRRPLFKWTHFIIPPLLGDVQTCELYPWFSVNHATQKRLHKWWILLNLNPNFCLLVLYPLFIRSFITVNFASQMVRRTPISRAFGHFIAIGLVIQPPPFANCCSVGFPHAYKNMTSKVTLDLLAYRS